MKRFQLIFMLLLATQSCFAALPYNEMADAHAELAQALAQAKNSDRKVLMIFGANWCPTCRSLDRSIRNGTTPVDDRKFVIVKIDVGNFDRNLDLVRAYGNPIRKGIPAAVVLTPDNDVLYRGSLTNFLMPYRRLMKIAMAAAMLLLAFGIVWTSIVLVRRHRHRLRHAAGTA